MVVKFIIMKLERNRTVTELVMNYEQMLEKSRLFCANEQHNWFHHLSGGKDNADSNDAQV
jgi:hypothetical protein